jgi:hypothetical protein
MRAPARNRERMCKGRRLAALAVGWYLLWPPAANHAEPDLRRWDHASSHDSADACQKSRQDTMKLLLAAADGKNANAQRALDTVLASRCIATDDPRLAPRSN